MEILQGQLPLQGNYLPKRTKTIQYIVIHYTANKGDTALNNIKYFANNFVKASAHYFVDESKIYSSVPVTDVAYHCGGKTQSNTGGKYYNQCTNFNSIGIEMCLLDKQGNVKDKTIKNTVELTRYLMEKYNIPAERVIRHWDVTGKMCPLPFVGDDNELWKSFKRDIQKQNDKSESDEEMVYNNINEVPDFAKPTIQKLCDKGFLKGYGSGLNLSLDMTRILVILDRTGVFG